VIRARLLTAVLLVPGLVAGCSSSTPKKAGGSSVAPSALAGTVDSALAGMTSAHLDIDAGSLGGTSTADVQLDHGAAKATDVHLTVSGTQVEVVSVGGTSYAKVPGAVKPWVVVSPDSSNAIAKSLATNTGVTDVLTSLSVLTGLVRSSSDVHRDGAHYTFTLHPQHGTGNAKLDSMLQLLGSTPVPAELWLDGSNRPQKLVLHIALGGSQFPITVGISKVNAPVSIQAPPASEVAS
jgi:hypothetical protein